MAGSSGAGTYSYTVKPTASSDGLQVGTVEIASTGTFSGVSRRVDVVAKSASGQQIFYDAAVKTQVGILLDSNAQIQAGAATGGDEILSSNAQQCGLASVGPGHHLGFANGGSTGYWANTNCSSALDPNTATQQDIVLPPVNQGDAPTNNDNARITRAVAASSTTPQDLISGKNSDVEWDPTTRQLHIDADDTHPHGPHLQLLQGVAEAEHRPLHRCWAEREHLFRLAGGLRHAAGDAAGGRRHVRHHAA